MKRALEAHRPIKDALFAEFALLGKAVANPHRLELLDLLSQAERSVDALAREAGLTVKNASAHLRVLRGARLVESRTDGTFVRYRLASPEVAGFLRALQDLGRAHLAEIDRIVREYYIDPSEMEAVDAPALLARARAGEALILDVRPREEFLAGHVAGATSIPLEELEDRLAELPAGREIVAYCRGPYCLFSLSAVELLRRRGFVARRMAAGPAEWRDLGLPISIGAAEGAEGTP